MTSQKDQKHTLAELRRREAKLMREEGRTEQEIADELGKHIRPPKQGRERV